jgi:hypothetical protein
MEKVTDTLLWGGRKEVILLNVSRASISRPSDKVSVKVKILGFEASEFRFSGLMPNCIIWKKKDVNCLDSSGA